METSDHLVLATSLPVLVPGGLHGIQQWNEAVCDGAWGRRAARVGERIRRAIDLEDWPAFRASFDRFVTLLRDVATPDRADGSPPPSTVCVLSGDVHFTYGVAATFDPSDGRPPAASAVHQLVCSPIRNALVHRERAVIRFANSRAGRMIGGALRRSVGNERPSIRWNRSPRVMFNNDMAMLVLRDRSAEVDLHNSGDEDDPHIVLSKS
jgi:hypothetical protein